MKAILFITVFVTFLSTYPPYDMQANRHPYHDTIPDSLVKLRQYADSQSISNMDKIQELEIKTIEMKLMKERKEGFFKTLKTKIKNFGKREKDYKIIYKKKHDNPDL